MEKKCKKYLNQIIHIQYNFIFNQYLGLKGISGLTAYFGLTKIGQVKKGEAVLISSAAGGVGVYAI